MSKKNVAISFLGSTLDQARRGDRWNQWRPNVALCQQDGLPIDRLELIASAKHQRITNRVVADIQQISPDTVINVHEMTLEDPWDFSEVYGTLRDFASTYHFKRTTEDYFVNITTGTHVAQICWFLLTETRFIPGRLLQLSPPRRVVQSKDDKSARQITVDYAGEHTVIDLDLSRYDTIAKRFAVEKEQATSFLKAGIQTQNTAFNDMIDQMERVAVRSKEPLLLMGPTGAGKSQLANRLYQLKLQTNQVSGKFVEVNCATLRGDQAMSTLFGHVRGAFAGAIANRQGLMKAAHKGVLFLDEIAQLGLDEQAMCLQAIEDKSFYPFGADRPVTSDFLLIAGSNQDLAKAVRKGTFREDLYTRLNMWTFDLPGLAQRREDIEPNLEFELAQFSNKQGQNLTFNKEARAQYLKFALSPEAVWSANFRDLSASVTRMGVLSPQNRINSEAVGAEIERLRARWDAVPDSTSPYAELIEIMGRKKFEELDLFDQIQLSGVIKICQKHQKLSDAGRTLYAKSRAQKTKSNDADRLKKYLAKFDLNFDNLILSEER